MLALLVAVAPARAQTGRVLGVVIDSLLLRDARPGEPFRRLAGASVSLGAGDQRVLTDSLGRFAFDQVPAGTHRVQYWDAWLERVGLGPLVGEVEVHADSTVGIVLGTPSYPTYHRLQCDAEPTAEFGVLIGELTRGAGLPFPGARVEVAWQETLVADGRAVTRVERRAGIAEASGRYVVCGVPLDVEVDVTVTGNEPPPIQLVMPIDAVVERRDFRLSAARTPAVIVGAVTDSAGRVLVGAEVVARGDSVVARSDSAGRFTVRVPGWGPRQYRIRALSHEPQRLDVEVQGEEVDAGVVKLTPMAQALDTMTVTAQADPLDWRPDFEHRRRIGLGGFITEEQLERMPRITASQVAQLARRVRVERGAIKLLYGTGACFPRWYVDGTFVGTEAVVPGQRGGLVLMPGEAQTHLDRARSIEVYSAAQAPPRFSDFNGCGAIVVWTR